MGVIFYLSECEDEKVLNHFEKLKSSLPIWLKDETKQNPFIQYIESVGRISEELLEFLYHSDFLSVITEKTIPAVETLYIRNAEIEWFYFIQKVFEESADNADEYVALIMKCFECQEDAGAVEMLLESSAMSDVNMFREKVEEYRKKVSEGMTGSSGVYDSSEECNAGWREPAPGVLEQRAQQELFCKGENDLKEVHEKHSVSEEVIKTLKKSHMLKDKIIALEKARNAELIRRIQKLEDTNDALMGEVADLKCELEEAKEELAHEQKELEKLQLRQTSALLSDDMEGDADRDGLEELALQEETEESKDAEADSEEMEIDYTKVSFAYDEMVEKESADEDNAEETVQEVDPYEYTDLENVIPDGGVIRRKCEWFFNHLFNYSRTAFLKRSTEEQKQLIFMKMMEIHLPKSDQKNVSKALADFGEVMPCFDLYRLISGNPTSDELMSFLSGVHTGTEKG